MSGRWAPRLAPLGYGPLPLPYRKQYWDVAWMWRGTVVMWQSQADCSTPRLRQRWKPGRRRWRKKVGKIRMVSVAAECKRPTNKYIRSVNQNIYQLTVSESNRCNYKPLYSVHYVYLQTHSGFCTAKETTSGSRVVQRWGERTGYKFCIHLNHYLQHHPISLTKFY